MKKTILLLCVVALFSGCAGLKTQARKAVDDAGLGGAFNFVSKKMTDLLGSELDVAQAEVARLKSVNVDAVAKTMQSKVKNENGVERDIEILKRYIVNATTADAARSVAKVANKSSFPGIFLIVSSPGQRAGIEAELKATIKSKAKYGKAVTIEFMDRRAVEADGYKPLVAWIPNHEEKKGGAV